MNDFQEHSREVIKREEALAKETMRNLRVRSLVTLLNEKSYRSAWHNLEGYTNFMKFK